MQRSILEFIKVSNDVWERLVAPLLFFFLRSWIPIVWQASLPPKHFPASLSWSMVMWFSFGHWDVIRNVRWDFPEDSLKGADSSRCVPLPFSFLFFLLGGMQMWGAPATILNHEMVLRMEAILCGRAESKKEPMSIWPS